MSQSIEINLNPSEMLLASSVGCMRMVQNLKNGWRRTKGEESGGPWEVHIEGAMGEMAVAKALGRFWNGAVGDYSAADVGRFQIKTTRHLNGNLLLNRLDRDGKYILVRGSQGEYEVVGWVDSDDVKAKQWWNERTPADRSHWLYPASRMHPISTLRKEPMFHDQHTNGHLAKR